MKRFEYRTRQQRFYVYNFHSTIVEFDFQNKVSYNSDFEDVKNSVVHTSLQRWNLFEFFMAASQFPILSQLILILVSPFSDQG